MSGDDDDRGMSIVPVYVMLGVLLATAVAAAAAVAISQCKKGDGGRCKRCRKSRVEEEGVN